MTRQDFVTIARILAVITGSMDRALATEKAIEECKRDNPRFDEQRFREAITRYRSVNA
jgi:hypothetical protein